MSKNSIYYKFFSLEGDSYKHAIQMIEKGELYMTSYQNMRQMKGNDNQEGIYRRVICPFDKAVIEAIKGSKLSFMIGCVTKVMRNSYMWKEYANNERGICIQFELVEQPAVIAKIEYENLRPKITPTDMAIQKAEELAKYILCHKTTRYSREQETRLLKKVKEGDEQAFLQIRITKIIFGRRINQETKETITKTVRNLESKIDCTNH